MKPNFAFTLSYQGIGLLHRAFPGWNLVGEVSFETADLAGDIARLRQKADELDATAIFSKLVIPNDQIKFLKISAQDLDQGDIEQRVGEALVGATPYDVGDLAFDYSIDGDTIYIAAVARETLAEAEGFATEHAFNPISFVAIPEAGTFSGEPFFGATKYATAIMADGEQISRDFAAISILGATSTPASPPAPEPETDPKAETETEAQIEPETTEFPVDAEAHDATNDETAFDTETQEAAPVAAFSSIRARRGDAIEDTTAPTPQLDGVERQDTDGYDDIPPAPSISFSTETAPDEDIFATPVLHATPHTDTAPPVSSQKDTGPKNGPKTGPKAAAKGAFFSRRLAKLGPNRDRSSAKPPKKIKAAKPANTVPTPVDEKQRMTIFGARGSEPVGGKPRFLGLILTAVLLLFLAGVAAWASIFLDEGLAGLFSSPTKDTAIASAPSEADSTALTSELAVEGDEASPQEPILASLPTGGPDAAFEPALSVPIEIDPTQAIADYAVTGIWQLPPEQPQAPPSEGLDSLYITSIDRAVSTVDAVALPDVRAAFSDLQPRGQISPVAPEIKFVFDARGLIKATPQGALTPDGITVFLGRPTAIPPTPPVREKVKDPKKEAETLRLAKLRPQSRPGNLVEQNERSILGGRTKVEMARLRPTARPRVTIEKQEEEADETATEQAVVASRKPNARPNNFSRIVKRAQKEQREQVTAVAAVAPRTVTPKVPSNAGVARLATTRKAINLKRINLIGVYGKPASRRALVRLSNGRYKKVKVGDRIDGGRISAIGESELRYNKSGRNVVLKMPRG